MREILPVQPATRVPGAPDQVAGLINVRGRIITLVDAHKCLGQRFQSTAGTLVLLELGSRTVGLIVDEVIDLISVAEGMLAERDGLPGIEAEFVSAVGRQGGESFALLDTDALLSPILL